MHNSKLSFKIVSVITDDNLFVILNYINLVKFLIDIWARTRGEVTITPSLCVQCFVHPK